MYLKSLQIVNFRKFGINNNIIEFIDSKIYKNKQDSVEINIAPNTTLIVGKNNSGKTTVTKALERLINNNKFRANDFNFPYLNGLMKEYKKSLSDPNLIDKVKLPFLEFKIIIGLEKESKDLVTNLIPFMSIENVNESEVEILIKYELEESTIFIENVKKILKDYELKEIRFKKLLELLDSTKYKLNYYNTNQNIIEKFNIKELIEIRAISANNIKNDSTLTNSFNTIIKLRYKSSFDKDKRAEMEKSISIINKEMTERITDSHTNYINEALGKIESSDKLKILLSSDLTFEKLLNNLIKYEYTEQNHFIPESQFGLGYANLISIIADLIYYIEKYPDRAFHSNINLISIEEPETFMHPQMQELFIKHINDAIGFLLNRSNKNINSQLIITTHSSHILNSKIHSGNTFNNINYVTTVNNHSNVVNLNDEKIKPDSDTKENDLKFLKKHIKYKVSELFFSDAIIFVEGITEDTLLHYYIDNNPKLNKHYISIFNINGAHGLVYHKLIKQLKVPTIIITDLDILRSKEDKETYKQVSILTNEKTTNETIKKYNNNSDKLDSLPEFFEEDNMLITYQSKSINGYFATSFEEALILTNANNSILNRILEKLKPNIYKSIVGNPINQNSINENSYKLQRKLSKSKSDFANELLYEFINKNDDETIPILPNYISNSLEWLITKLEGEKI